MPACEIPFECVSTLLTRWQSRPHRQIDFKKVNILPYPTFRLITLGRLTLQGGEGAPAADALRKQRRKLAVLATLALERAPIPRDVLTDMFWGEQEELRARHSLSDALSHLRRVLGPHSITARGTDVALDPAARLKVDARELRNAMEAERWRDAVQLYDGPFLDGVHPGGSSRLESWIDRERRELEALFLRACERAYADLRVAARWEEALAVARRWLDANPLSEAAAIALLGALEAPDTDEAGTRALQAYEALRLRLDRDYGAFPSERVQARAAVLAERLAASCPPSVSSGEAPIAEAADSKPDHDLSAHSSDVAVRRRFRRSRLWLAAGAAVVLLGVPLWLAVTTSSEPDSNAFRIAVLPFDVRGPPEYTYLREGVVDLLSADLDGAGPFRTVDPQAVLVAAREPDAEKRASDLAARLGAGLFIRGDVVVAGSHLRISAVLYQREPGGRRIAEATVDGSPDDLFQLVDRLTAQLLAGSGSPVPPLGRLAALTTGSLPALKAYLEGESELREGLYASAFEAFRRATALDTTFALAHYRVAQAATWAVPPDWGWDSIRARGRLAAARADRLAPRAKLLVEAYAAWIEGAYDEAERGYRAVVRTYPDDVEAWYGLGEVLFHTNPVRGRPSVESGVAFERVLALEPHNLAAMTHLLRIRLRERRSGDADSLGALLEALEAPPQTAQFHALRAFSHGTEIDRVRALAELRASGNDELVRMTAHRVAVYSGSIEGATRILPLLLHDGLAADVRAHALVWLAQLEIARGRWQAADQALNAATSLDPVMAAEERALLAALPFAPAATTRAAAAEAALLRLDPGAVPTTTYPYRAVYNGLHRILREYLLGILELRQADYRATRERAETLAALASGRSRGEAHELARGLGQSLLAHLAVADARAPEGLKRFEAARLRVSEGLLETPLGSQAYERWARAELLLSIGRLREALPWYATLAETHIDALIYLAPAEFRQAEILERLGDAPGAAQHYRRFLELWGGADAELSAWVTRARIRLQALKSA
jgi:DNA-binding SARP family transcriptional activator/TolB-like protein